MVKKIGDLAIAGIILVFLISAFTIVITEFDVVTSTTSGITTDLRDLDNNASGVSTLEKEFTTKIDETGQFVVEQNEQVDVRASEAGGILNLFSKNVVVRFLSIAADKLNIPGIVLALILSLITVTITILTIRFFIGEGKV